MKGVISAIMKKDINAVVKNKQTLPGLLIIPIMFGIAFPIIFTFGFINEFESAGEFGDMMGAFANMILLIPVMIASMTSAESIAGEREKKTIETLLYSPVPLRNIFAAKVLSAFVPAVIVGVVCGVASMLIVNIPAAMKFGQWAVSPERYAVILALLAPAVALISVDLMVYASAKAKSMNAASQWSLLLVFPIIVIAQVAGAFDVYVGVIVGAVLLALGILFIFKVFGMFTRPILLEGIKKTKKKMSIDRKV